jgi:hypothetical protein
MQQNTTEIFRDAPVPKAVLSNVIPSIISMIMVLIYNLADTFFIGQTKNALMVAAVSVATPAFLLFMAVGMLFGIGGTSFISRMLGEGQEERAKHASAFCFWTGLAVGIISMILIVIFAEPVCKAIGASPDTIEYATQYLRIVAIGIPMIIPDIAVFARPSERMMLLNALLMIRNGIPMATIRRYWVAYSIVSGLAPIALQTGSAKITIKIIDMIPTASPVQKQNAEACLARSS